MPIGWKPQTTIQDRIVEEEEKIKQLRDKQVVQYPSWLPPVATQSSNNDAEKIANIPDITMIPTEGETQQFTPTQKLITSWMPQQVQPPVNLSPGETDDTIPQVTEGQKQWWEQPAVWTGKAGEAIGEGISKIPVLPKVLGFLEKPLTWVSEHIEKPWAAIITAPWSPSLPWQSGETWVEHEKREYDTWKAPTYVKGLAEFSMPLWWMPWFGWTAKGARALGVGNKATRAIATIGKVGKVELPTAEVLNQNLYKPDFLRTLSIWAEHKPVLGSVVKALGGESAFVRAESRLPEDIVKREIVNRAVIRDMAGSVQNLIMPRLQKFGNPIKVLDIADDGLVRSITPLKEGASKYLYDVLEHPTDYKFATKEAKAYVDELHNVLGDARELAIKEGIKVPKDISVHRIVVGKTTEKGFEASEFGSLFERERTYKTMVEGVKAGVKYGINPNESVASTIRHYVRQVADKRFGDEIKKLGVTPLQKFAEKFPEEATRITDLANKMIAGKYALQSLQRITSYRGTSVPGAVLTKIRGSLPEVAQKIDDAFALAPDKVDKVLNNMSTEIRRVMKMSPKEFNFIVKTSSNIAETWRGKKIILMSDIDDAIRHLNISDDVAARAIEKGYRQSYQLNKQAVKDVLRTTQDEVKSLLDISKTELKPLMVGRRQFLEKYKYGGQILGEQEKMTNAHPAFRGLVFDREVVNTVEKELGDRGNKWVRDMGQIGGVSRMLTATLDFSAPFIQGLAVLGRNPILWAKSVGKQFEFFARPQNLIKYMADPTNMAIRVERVAAGGSTLAFEYFESLKAFQDVTGKIGKVVIPQTFGRAEAAFTGFAEVTRNEMWRVLRKPNMPQGELRELARSLDRMTGVMSTEALAIGKTQRDFESAWVFFAPRYTRASLSYISDMFKGGLTGAEARKALGGLMGGGMAMYYGTCKALGQQPNLDPTSSKFMTIKIGDQNIGVGGMLYSLARLGGNLVTVESPGDLLALNRTDNPFLNFMYSKSAPLTGLTVGLALEHKNYLGQPFENPADWAKFLADKVTPIALQNVMPWSEEKNNVGAFIAQELGGRTFPKSPSQLRDEARDRYATQQFNKPYKVLPKLSQQQIDNMPDVKKFSEEADKRAVELGNALSVGFIDRQSERDDARFVYEDDLNKAQQAVDDGLISPYDFRETLQTEGQRLGATYEHIDRQLRYKPVIEKLNNPQNVNPKFIGDIAYDELMSASYSNQFEDKYGIFDYDAYNKFKESLRIKYGDDVYNYVLARQTEGRKNLPPLAQEYYKAQDILKPYWEVESEIVRMFGQQYAESKNGQTLTSKVRKQLRMSNPEIDKYYRMFYTQI